MKSQTKDTVSIHINVDGFSFFLPEEESSIINKKNYPIESNHPEKLIERLKEIFQLEKIDSYTHIRLIVSNKLFTLIPNQLFDENRISDYIEFNSFLLPNDPIESKLIEKLDIQFLYSYNELIEEKIRTLFPNKELSITHSGISLIEQLASFSPEKNFFIWFNFSSIEITYFNNGSLIFYNYFETETKEDVLYYILFVAQQLDIDVNKDPLHVLGHIENLADTIAMMKKYIRHVKIGINENISFKEFIL